jgi:ATP dependent DNA ligase-like protein
MTRKASISRSKRQYVEGHNSAALRLARSFPQAKPGILPRFIPPSLATLAPRPPRGKGWFHEIKYDGYRFQCHIQRTVRFFTRRGHDWTERLTHLAQALQSLTDRAMILDGEVIVETPEGKSDFHALEKELSAKGGSQRLILSSMSSMPCISAAMICETCHCLIVSGCCVRSCRSQALSNSANTSRGMGQQSGIGRVSLTSKES